MSGNADEYELTEAEREIARLHWHALMFATYRLELEAAQVALMQAPTLVQQAVMTDINALWLREHTPTKYENPFLPTRSQT